jgi:hypothetical protein
MTYFTNGILKSAWRVRLETNHCASAIARRVFGCNLWMLKRNVYRLLVGNPEGRTP